jgi:tetratricopeptide (TPR) repeat protein
MGLVQRATQQYGDAMQNFEKALSLSPDFLDAFTNIIFIHATKREFDIALKKCEQQLAASLKDRPAHVPVLYNLMGRLYLSLREKARAEDTFKSALRVNPDFMPPYYALARIYLSEGKADQAIAQYEAALEANPKQSGAHMLLAVIYDSQQDTENSEKHYRAALEINPDFAPAANNLAFILADQDKDIDEALQLARLAKEKLPNDAHVMDTLGWVYYKKGLYDSAIGEFSDSLVKLADNAVVNYHIGMAFYKKGNTARAREYLEKALSLQSDFPGSEEARQVLAEL